MIARVTLAAFGAVLAVACGASDSAPSAGAAGSSSSAAGAGGSGSGGAIAQAGKGGATAGSASGGATSNGGAGGGLDGVGGSPGAGGGAAGGSTVGCAALPLCDDFEGVAPGSPPDGQKWIATVLSDCPSTAAIKPMVTGSQHHGGTRALEIKGNAGYCDYAMVGNETALAAIGSVVYGRYYVRLEAALPDGHTAFMAFRDEALGGKALRFGGQNKALQWNRQSDDATLPEQSPMGIGLSKALVAGEWTCVEFMIDQKQGSISTWVKGALITGLVADAAPTPDVDAAWGTTYRPKLTSFNLGWQNYGAGPMTLWFDDVALSAARIGCD